jgi:hypothetical protein
MSDVWVAIHSGGGEETFEAALWAKIILDFHAILMYNE